MNKNKINDDQFSILREIKYKSNTSQRTLAKNLGFSLGKLNYCLKSLKEKGLLKINNFKRSSNKLDYVYVITPKGISQKKTFTINFMKRKMREYDELKKEMEKDI